MVASRHVIRQELCDKLHVAINTNMHHAWYHMPLLLNSLSHYPNQAKRQTTCKSASNPIISKPNQCKFEFFVPSLIKN